MNFAISKSNEEYRTFVLVSINDHAITPAFHARNKRNQGTQSSLNAKRAATKIFSQYCQHFKIAPNVTSVLKIQETTKGSDKKIYVFEATNQELDTPIVLEKVDGKFVRIASVEEATNAQNVIEYKHKNVLKTVKT